MRSSLPATGFKSIRAAPSQRPRLGQTLFKDCRRAGYSPAIIDGEVVVVHEGRTNFSELQAELAGGRQDQQPIETNEYQPINGAEGGFRWSRSPQNLDLLP